MKLELKENMYVRTNKGFIAKIEEFKYHYTKGKRLVDGCSVKEVVENYLLLDGNQCRLIESIDYSIPPCYPSDEELDEIKSHIVKASYSIIDLIEVGDHVNGYKIGYIDDCKGAMRQFYYDYENPNNDVGHWEEEIKSVITHEQIEQMEYRIGE